MGISQSCHLWPWDKLVVKKEQCLLFFCLRKDAKEKQQLMQEGQVQFSSWFRGGFLNFLLTSSHTYDPDTCNTAG